MTIRRFLLACLLCLLPLAAQAAKPLNLSPEEQTWLSERIGPLRVHNEQDWTPYNFNQNGRPQGYSIDYMNLLARKLGIKVEYVSGPNWNQFLDMMKAKSLDVMLNIANTKERREYLAFTEPYYITSVGLYVKDGEAAIHDLGDLAGRRLAFPKGFFFEEFIRNYYPAIKITAFESAPASFKAVAEGRADAVMDIPGVARRIIRDAKIANLKFAGKVSDPRFITTFSLATHKDNRILRDILQKAMDSVTPEEERELGKRWNVLDREVDPSIFSQDDKTYLQQVGRLRFCAHPDMLPLEAVTIDGAYTGVASEFVKMLGERLSIPLQLVQTGSWTESQAGLVSDHCDILPLAVVPEKDDGALLFTKPWLRSELVIATRPDQIYISDLRQIQGRDIGILAGGAETAILQRTYPGLQLVETASVNEGLKAVETGRLFGFVGTLPVIGRNLQSSEFKGVKISGNLGLYANYAVAVRGDDPRLQAILDHAIAALDEDAIGSVYKRWLAVAYVERVDYSHVWQLLAGFSLVILFVLYHYRRTVRFNDELKLAQARLEAANQVLDEKNQALDQMARTDPLTGLFNRHMINETLQDELNRFQRYGSVFSVILLDIDHFKDVNDAFGHQAGDLLLKNLAQLLRQHTRSSDIVGRWGGEEFLIVCPSTAHDGALRMAETLRGELEKSSVDSLPRQTASFGVASIHPGESVDQLISRADQALYQAKAQGRNRVAG